MLNNQPSLPIGTVYGVLLNVRSHFDAIAPGMSSAPYNAPPKTPILYIKTPNTYRHPDCAVAVPGTVAISASLAVIIGRTATRVPVDRALDYVRGYTVAADIHLPHPDFFRPSIKQRCRDGFLPIGTDIVARVGDDVAFTTSINSVPQATFRTSELIRPLPQLLADITDFMTLNAGDVLLVGAPPNMPLAKGGDTVSVAIDTVGALTFSLTPENTP